MTAIKLKNKYPKLWENIYHSIITDLQFVMPDIEIQRYKSGQKKCRLLIIAYNSTFNACYELDKLLSGDCE